AGGHIDLCPQYARTVFKFTCPHTLEKIQVFIYRAITVWAILTWGRQCAAIFPYLLGAQVAHICLALSYKLYRIIIEFIEIVGCIVKTVTPVEPEPADIRLY